MPNLSRNIENKITILKEIVTSRSLLKDYRGDISWTYDISMDTDDSFEELILYVKVRNVECPDCSFEPETIHEQTMKFINTIYGSVQTISFDNKLNIVKSNMKSLRGVLIHELKYSFDELEFEFGIYIDPITY
jgi:hypothetical protein